MVHIGRTREGRMEMNKENIRKRFESLWPMSWGKIPKEEAVYRVNETCDKSGTNFQGMYNECLIQAAYEQGVKDGFKIRENLSGND